jgi:hypothetical protein
VPGRGLRDGQREFVPLAKESSIIPDVANLDGQSAFETMRRLMSAANVPRAALASTALALALAGCSNSGGATTVGTTASSARALAVAFARAINIKPQDVPGMTLRSAEGLQRAGGLIHCEHRIAYRHRAIHSARFASEPASVSSRASGFESVFSTVYLAPSSHSAAREVEFSGSPEVERCVAREEQLASGARGPLVNNHVTVSTLPLSVPGPSFAFRADSGPTYRSAHPQAPRTGLQRTLEKARQVGVTIDHFGFADGRAEVTLMDLHVPGPPPIAKERHLLRLLYARVHDHRP